MPRRTRPARPTLLSRLLTALVANLLFAVPGFAEDVAVSQARWISVDDPPAPNQWIAFRRDFELDSALEPTTLKVAVDSKYWLWLDGQQLVFEGGLKRGPTPTDTYVDSVSLPRLEPGKHRLCILVWFFGKHGFSHNNSGRGGLFVDHLDAHLLDSDSNWRAKIHPAFGNTEDPKPNYRLPESNIHFDARTDVSWLDDNDRTDDWPAAVVVEGPESIWGKLVDRPIPFWKDFGTTRYANDAELNLPRTSTGETFVGVLPHNAQVTPVITIRVPERDLDDQVIDIRTDNYRGGGPPNVRAEYVPRTGRQTYENLGWMNGHAVHYRIPEGIEVLSLGYRQTGYATEMTGGFECDDEFLNRLHEKAMRTLYITMRDTYFDCPDRERAQWWGDAVLELGEAFYALDPRSHRLARKGILELMGWQRDDGTIFSPVPAGNYDGELPMQMLASVGHYGFYTYALHSGDIETIREVYPKVVRYLDVWKIGDDGLVVPRKGGWTWGDWGENKDMPLLYNGWYHLALRGQREMALLLGRSDDADQIATTLVAHADTFNRTFWTGSQYRSADYQGMTDERGHALAVVAGIADESKYEAIEKVFRNQKHASPYMEKYVLEALYQMRKPELALQRMKQRYQKMVESELTTLWEGWGIGAEGFGGGTINHAWSGGPLTLMSQCIVGIVPTSPGYRTFRIDPQLGPLEEASATVDSVSGEIQVSLKRRPAGIEVDVVVPEGCQAELVETATTTVTLDSGSHHRTLPTPDR